MAQHRQHEGVDVPAGGQEPVDEQQPAEHRLAQQVPGLAGRDARRTRRRGGSSCAVRTQNQRHQRQRGHQQEGQAEARRGRSSGRRANGPRKFEMAGPIASQENTCLSCVGFSAARPDMALQRDRRRAGGAAGQQARSGKAPETPERRRPGPRPTVAAITRKPMRPPAGRAGRHSARPAAPGTPGSARTAPAARRRPPRCGPARSASSGAAMRVPAMQACRKIWPAIRRASAGSRPPLMRALSSPSVDRRQQRLGLRLGQRLDHLQRASHLVGPRVAPCPACRTPCAPARVIFSTQVAVALELGLDGAQHLPDLGGLLLQRQRAEAHVQAVEHRQQRGRAGQRHAVVALQAVHQAGAAQHLGIEAFDRQEQDREVGGVRRAQVAAR